MSEERDRREIRRAARELARDQKTLDELLASLPDLQLEERGATTGVLPPMTAEESAGLAELRRRLAPRPRLIAFLRERGLRVLGSAAGFSLELVARAEDLAQLARALRPLRPAAAANLGAPGGPQPLSTRIFGAGTDFGGSGAGEPTLCTSSARNAVHHPDGRLDVQVFVPPRVVSRFRDLRRADALLLLEGTPLAWRFPVSGALEEDGGLRLDLSLEAPPAERAARIDPQQLELVLFEPIAAAGEPGAIS